MNKREFLSKSFGALLGLGACALGSGLPTYASEAKKKIIGLQLYSLRDAMGKDPRATLEAVAKMGYTTLETASYNQGKFYGMAPKELRKIIEDLGMRVTSGHLMTGNDPNNQKAVMDWWKQAFDAQAELGATYTIFPWINPNMNVEQLDALSEYFSTVAALGKAHGTQFGFHNHAGEFANRDGLVTMDYLIEHTSDDMAFQLDVYWAQKGGVNPAAYIKKNRKKIKLLHIKDESIIGDSGELRFDEIFAAAYEVGIKDYYVEVERYSPLPPEGCVQKSFDFLNNASFIR